MDRDGEHLINARELLNLLNGRNFDGDIQIIAELKYSGQIIDEVKKWIEDHKKDKKTICFKNVEVYLNMWHDYFLTENTEMEVEDK